MKIVGKEEKNSIVFSLVKKGEVFLSSNRPFIKASGSGIGVDLGSGSFAYFSPISEVILKPNAEVHLD